VRVNRATAAALVPFAELPEGLSDPLHLLRPWPGWLLPLLLTVLALALLTWWRRRRRRRPAAAPSPPPSARRRSPQARPLTAVEALRRRYRDAVDLRPGFDELSALLRGWLVGGLSLTASEVAARVDDEAAARLLGLVARHQFGRREPTAEDLDSACDLTAAVVTARTARRAASRGAAAPAAAATGSGAGEEPPATGDAA
jgi:hypothetical protein